MRVLIQQPVLAHYRLGVFEALARRSGIELTVAYDHFLPTQPARPLGFALRRVPLVWSPASREAALWRAGTEKLRWQRLSLRDARGHLPDAVVVEWSLRSVSMFPLLLGARASGTGSVLWGHGYSLRERKTKRALRRAVTRLSDSVLFYDAATAASYVAEGVPEERVFVAPNTMDLRDVWDAARRWTQERIETFQREHGLNGRRAILFASRLQPGRRLIEVVEALRYLPDDVVLLVIGSGAEEAPARRVVAERGLLERVRFLGALYDEDALAPWFLSARVMCVPCRLGLALFHAFAYGLPVVASEQEPMPELSALRHGVNGMRTETPDPEALARALEPLLFDDALRSRLSEQAASTARARSVDAMVDGMESALHAAVERARRTSR